MGPSLNQLWTRVARQVKAWAGALRGRFGGEQGIDVEAKLPSVVVHYRGALGKPDPHRRMLHAALALPGGRVLADHAVLTIVPREFSTKAHAIETLARRLTARSVVFVGDDVTDEDAFRSPSVGLAIGVGASESTVARYFLTAQAGIDDLLRAFVSARVRAGGFGERWRALGGPPSTPKSK